MRFLQRRRAHRWPVIAVTCESDLRRTLLDAGADRVVLLPDNDDSLKRSLAMLVGEPAAMAARSGKLSRLRQHFGF